MKATEEAAWERLLEWGLRETEGGERAASGDLPQAAAPPQARMPGPTARGRWLAAAVVLLGMGAVIAVTLSRGQPAGDAPLQQPGGGDYRRVESAAEIAALPADTRFVTGVNLTDKDMAVLTRLRDLEGLRLLAATFVDDIPPLGLLTDVAIPHLATFTRLRVLDLDGQVELTGAGLDVLLRLPLLEELRLQRFDVGDQELAFLPRLPALRILVLTLNHGFRQHGMQAIGRCTGLRSLTLHACSQLNGAMLAEIDNLANLEELNLRRIGLGWRGHHVGRSTPEATAIRDRQVERALQDGAGLGGDALAFLSRLRGLRTLKLGGGNFAVDGLSQLKNLALRELDLSDSPQLDSTFVDLLPPMLERLDVSVVEAHSTSALTDDDVRALRLRLPLLTHVSLAGCASITDVAVAELLALPQLRELDVSRCPGVTETSLDLILHARQIHALRLDELPWLDLARAEKLFSKGIAVKTGQADTELGKGLRELAERYRDVARGR